jgi:hypothetical protein
MAKQFEVLTNGKLGFGGQAICNHCGTCGRDKDAERIVCLGKDNEPEPEPLPLRSDESPQFKMTEADLRKLQKEADKDGILLPTGFNIRLDRKYQDDTNNEDNLEPLLPKTE